MKSRTRSPRRGFPDPEALGGLSPARGEGTLSAPGRLSAGR
jgi:hypothetical protein